jgi:hypothetical protein
MLRRDPALRQLADHQQLTQMPGVRTVGLRSLLVTAQRARLRRLGEMQPRARRLQLRDHEPPPDRRLQRHLKLPTLEPRRARPERRSGRTDPTYAPRPVCIGRRPPCLRRVPGPGCVVMGPFVGVRALARRLLFRDPPRGGAHHRRGRYARTGLTTAARSGRSVSPEAVAQTTAVSDFSSDCYKGTIS